MGLLRHYRCRPSLLSVPCSILRRRYTFSAAPTFNQLPSLPILAYYLLCCPSFTAITPPSSIISNCLSYCNEQSSLLSPSLLLYTRLLLFLIYSCVQLFLRLNMKTLTFVVGTLTKIPQTVSLPVMSPEAAALSTYLSCIQHGIELGQLPCNRAFNDLFYYSQAHTISSYSS